MNIKINGTEESFDKEVSLLELTELKGLNPEKIVVEHNMKIIPKEELTVTMVKEDDNLEIVSFVGGG